MWSYLTSFLKKRSQELSGSPPPSTDRSDDDEDDDEEPEAKSAVKVLFRARGTLFQRSGNTYEPLFDLGSLTLQLEVRQADRPAMIFIYNRQQKAELALPVVQGLQMNYNFAAGSLHWGTAVEKVIVMMAFKFVADNEYKRFMKKGPLPPRVSGEIIARDFIEIYNSILYSHLTKTELPDSVNDDDDDFAYAAGGFSNEVPVEDESQPPPVADDSSNVPVFALGDISSVKTTGSSGTNTCFADSIIFSRAVVLQKSRDGKSVIAQAHTYDQSRFTDTQPQEFVVKGLQSAKESLLANNEHALYVLDDLDRAVVNLDLESGSVVAKYQPNDGLELDAIAHYGKFADSGPPLVSCLNHNSAFTIDMRLDPKRCVVTEEGSAASELRYSLKGKGNKFMCHATSTAGHLAVGDMFGDVRLFTGPPGSRKAEGQGHHPKLAKTLLKCLVPILHLDITADGRYVLVTTQSQLLVLSTMYDDDKGKSCNGFAQRMGKHKPLPLRLQPSPQQMQTMGGPDKLDFTKATFEFNKEQNEHWVVACSGTFILTWSFDAVKKALTKLQNVPCEVKDTNRKVQSVTMVGGQERVTFLSDTAVGMETRSQSRKSGKFSVRFGGQ